MTRTHRTTLQRRNCLALGLASVVLPAAAWTEANNITGAQLQAMGLRSEGLRMDLPNIADTSASVPMRADIQAPAGVKVQTIDVYLPENPTTLAIRLRLAEPQANYSFTTRLRLAGSQRVWLVVTLSDGSLRGTSAATEVISSSCFDGS